MTVPTEVQLTPAQWVEVMKALQETQKHDPASTTLAAPALHGPLQGNNAQYGLFSRPGVRPERFSTLVRTRSLARVLGVRPSRMWQELLEVMSGVTAASGTNADNWCANPPTTPVGKVAQQIYKFGKWYAKTNLNALPEIGMYRDRADVPGEILNAAPQERNPLIPDLMYRIIDDTDSQLRYELFLMGVGLERSLEKVLITGDITQASNATEWGWMVEFNGLDSQIKTGYTDAVSGLAVPAMDSAITTWNASVGGTVSGSNFVQAVSDMVWSLRDIAASMGMEGVDFAIAMRAEAFRAAVENWACNYATYRCSTTVSGVSFNNDLSAMNDLRLEMMNGQYLLVDNVPVQVIFSDGIPQESQGGGQFMSDIYVVPVSWNGMRLINIEYFDMNNAPLQEYASFAGSEVVTLNNGMFLVGKRSTGLCMEYLFASKMRLILETPWLSGRIDNVQYITHTTQRNADPADSHFYRDGGISFRT